MQDIQRIISSTLPQQENGEVVRLLEAFLQSAGNNAKTILPAVDSATQEISAPVDQNLSKQETTLRTCFRMMNKN